MFNVTRPPVPYGQQTEANSLVTETGFKSVRGMLTEGRFLTFELDGRALSALGSYVVAQRAYARHDGKSQRWVIHQTADAGVGARRVLISSALNGRFMARGNRLTSDVRRAEQFGIVDLGNGKGYTLQDASGRFMSIGRNGRLESSRKATAGWKVFSVTF